MPQEGVGAVCFDGSRPVPQCKGEIGSSSDAVFGVTDYGMSSFCCLTE